MGEKLDKMRAAATSAKPPTTKPAPKKPPAKAPPKSPNRTAKESILYKCGHVEAVVALETRACIGCSNEGRRKARIRRSERREKRRLEEEAGKVPQKGRLPDGSEFHLGPYNAAEQTWDARLTVPGLGEFVTTGQSGVKGCYYALDRLYRQAITPQSAEPQAAP